MKDRYEEIFGDINRVLIVLAHPDDMEIICGGTIARLIDDGKTVRSVILTDGQKGMHDQEYSYDEFKKIRIKSQKSGGKELGIEEASNINFDIPDGEVESDLETIGKIVEQIREFRPQLVITHKPIEMINQFSDEIRWINHRDHRNTATATFDAIYPYSIDHGFYPEQIEKGMKGWTVSKILTSDTYIDENSVAFDITHYVEKKRCALMHHREGNVLTTEGVNDLVEECKEGDRYFERLGFVEL